MAGVCFQVCLSRALPNRNQALANKDQNQNAKNKYQVQGEHIHQIHRMYPHTV